MAVYNVHERLLPVEQAEVASLVDGLASDNDGLWPHGLWPAIRFDRPLGVGAVGGHGRSVTRFTPTLPVAGCVSRSRRRAACMGSMSSRCTPRRAGERCYGTRWWCVREGWPGSPGRRSFARCTTRYSRTAWTVRNAFSPRRWFVRRGGVVTFACCGGWPPVAERAW